MMTFDPPTERTDPERTEHTEHTETDHSPSGRGRAGSPAATSALVTATVLSGLFAGFFLTYSMSVQLGLAEVDDLTYVRTFQAINATIRNPVFAVVFFGCVPAIATAAMLERDHRTRARPALAAGGLLCLSVVAITFVANVPLNDQLATYVDLDAAAARTARDEFESSWNRWNHARSAFAVAGAIAVASAWPLRRRETASR